LCIYFYAEGEGVSYLRLFILRLLMEIIRKECLKCGQVIEGTKQSEVDHNLEVHMMTHKRVKKNCSRVER